MDYSGRVAVIGVSCAFPGAANPSEYWMRLCNGEESIRFFGHHNDSDDKSLLSPSMSNDTADGGVFVAAVSCMDGIDQFDSAFFGMPPAEADITDPQHRVLLEHAWRALEDAGYDPTNCKDPVGVFAGATTGTYLVANLTSRLDIVARVDPLQLNLANGADFLCTRISYKLNLRGPSLAVQSACSTSLVAVHTACRSLMTLECDMALAGGVSINPMLQSGYHYRQGGILSPDGHCRPFDRSAQGTLFGCGVGMVVLKRLEDALAHKDPIYAVIRGSAVNNDGLTKAGYAAPSVTGQTQVIAEAISAADVEPSQITYVECHGTATAVGDVVELCALGKVFSKPRPSPCLIGSVKGNFGHLDAAAGMAGLIKVVLSLKHGLLPPSINCENVCDDLDLRQDTIALNLKLCDWLGESGRLIAGVSAFGMGGTNAHVILERAPDVRNSPIGDCQPLILISGKTAEAVRRSSENLASYLRQHPDTSVQDVAYTLQAGRKHFIHRRAVVGARSSELANALDQQSGPTARIPEVHMPVIFAFEGYGLPDISELKELCADFARRRMATPFLEALEKVLGSEARCVVEKLFSSTSSGDARSHEHTTTPWLDGLLLLALRHSAARALMSYGVCPEAIFVTGFGKYTAGPLAEVITLESAVKLAISHLKTGDSAALTAHSCLRDDDLSATLLPSDVSPARIQIISDLTGRPLTDDEICVPDYWLNIEPSTTNSAGVLTKLFRGRPGIVVHIGAPGTSGDRRSFYSITEWKTSSQSPSTINAAHCTELLGRLWERGVKIDWDAIHRDCGHSRVSLPTYPFERQRHWVERGKVVRDTAKLGLDKVVGEADVQVQPLTISRPELRNPYVEPENEVERVIVSVLQQNLGIASPGVTDKYGELGGDSLSAVKIVSDINRKLGCSFEVLDLYDSLTARELAQKLRQLDSAWEPC